MDARNILYLDSVGTYFNKETLNTYADINDTENSVHLTQVSDEWIKNLSKNDFLKIFKK